jgi:hypothetical protein
MPSHSEVSFPTSDGSELSFRVTRRISGDVEFLTTVETPWIHCASPASTYLCGPPTTLFADLAENWRGWNDEKRWADLEGRVALAATADALGHVVIKVTLKGPNYRDFAEVRVNFEAGALIQMSLAIASIFGSEST